MNFLWFFSLSSPSQICGKRCSIWGFFRFRESGVISGNPSIPLDLASFGGPNHRYAMPMRYS
jgi:hypothetical protein